MSALSRFIFLCAFAVTLCAALTPCARASDTASYYAKYYAARRYTPTNKRSMLLTHNFTLHIPNIDALQDFESVALSGDLTQLGGWRASQAVRMNRTALHNVWQATLQLPVNVTLNYRYLVVALDASVSDQLLVRRWESGMQTRSFNTSIISGTAANHVDTFGHVEVAGERVVQRGWLNAGALVHFKLLRNPLTFVTPPAADTRIFVRVQPVDPQSLTPILPSARASTEYARWHYGESQLRVQPEYGVRYDTDDILIFETQLMQLQRVAYLLKIYSADVADADVVQLVGYQYLQPSALTGSGGNLSIELISPTWLTRVGTLQLQYLVVTPLPAAENVNSINSLKGVDNGVDLRLTFGTYWRANWTALEAGHRGLGKSFKQTQPPAAVENTLASMQAAAALGADLVEFDVMLTSDLQAIIHHDYFVYVCLASKTPTSKDDLTQVFIKDLTYEQLKSLKTYQIVGAKIVEYEAHNNVVNVTQRLFPLFSELLDGVDRRVGFDIEIKWPQLKRNGVLESVQTIDKNLYVDRILAVMQQHGCGRLSFFTSFDVDICAMLRYKQHMYPVMLLSSSVLANFEDPRTDNIYASVNTAQALDLAGIVPNALFIKQDPQWVKVANDQQKLIFVWGDSIKDVASIEWFKDTGVTGVIYDRMDQWLPAEKQSAFGQEHDLPAFFQRQCKPRVIGGGAGNATVDSILSNVNMF